jgi:hypothetical protein
LRLLASDGSTPEAINKRIASTKYPLPFLKASGKEIWETEVRLKGDEKAAATMFFVMGMLGFSVYL